MSSELDNIIQKVVSLRSRGRYQEALHQLEASEEFAYDSSLRGEKSLIYVLQHRHGELLQLLPETPLDYVHSESKEESFSRILRDFAQLHRELKLHEAVISSEAVARRWLMSRETQEYDRLDVYMITLYAVIQSWGERFLLNLGVNESDSEHQSRTMIGALCTRLLQTCRFEELLLTQIFVVEMAQTTEDISNSRKILNHIRMYLAKMGLASEDLEAHIRLLLYGFHHLGDEQGEPAATELQDLQSIFNCTENTNGAVWVELYTIFPRGNPSSTKTGSFELLLNKFKGLDDWRGARMCHLAIAKIHRNKQNFKAYTATLMSLLKIKQEANVDELPIYGDLTKSQSQKTPIVKRFFNYESAKSTAKENGKRRAEATYEESSKRRRAVTKHQDLKSSSTGTYRNLNEMSAPHENGSLLDFWIFYMDLMGEDVGDSRRIGSTIVICSQFFEKHPGCSIPQLQFFLAMAISESYGVLGNVSMAMNWAARASSFAEISNDEQLVTEARQHLESWLSSYATLPAGDPTAMRLREKVKSRKADLEILYQATGTHEHFMQQFEYACNLLEMQLLAEIESKTNPVGEPWLSRVRQVVEKLPQNEKEKARYRTHFAVAHAKFEFGDYDTAIRLLDEVVNSCDNIGYVVLKSHALFTKGRVYLQLYTDLKDEAAWKNSYQDLQTSMEISSRLDKSDCVACCHNVLAALWRKKVSENPNARFEALRHIGEAEGIWSEQMKNIDVLRGLSGVVTRYSLRHQGIANPYDTFGTAFSICFETSDFATAWEWAQRAKARAFCDSLRSIEAPVDEASIQLSNLSETKPERGMVYVHWVTAGDLIYMLTYRVSKRPEMFLLDINYSTVAQWYSDLVDSQDDLSDAENAEEALAELNCLIEPLGHNGVSTPGELLVLCPTKVLFKIPLHALFLGNQILLSRNPILYTHVITPLQPQQQSNKYFTSQRITQDSKTVLFGNPTGDVISGEKSVKMLGESLGGKTFVKEEATKQAYTSHCLNSRLVHYHGHATAASQGLGNSMIFHEGEQLQAREVFSLDLRRFSPLICLIGCGSGAQLLRIGDEPLGFVSAFLYAGASAVVASLWPIHDSLSGSAFAEIFYKDFVEETRCGSKPVDLALSLQKAALAIRSREETRAPYFWAGFVLHGQRSFQL